ncbi:hypothetical protein ADIARSV_3514 [Arcticibacter svalbardensis MN12-7]|uniref:Uncharacterized protein n=1 Tax=Arcticibacter svalbardensis MN12-7 TaxID=1150600 RepID=R9GNK6_9SPHI|nr:hypothetical protein [Arcticibacter svalbardensis]EOR93303.1 hypothetical protein ADIARSV_3514 [Arcticibacter svalbardensis MN12-7]
MNLKSYYPLTYNNLTFKPIRRSQVYDFLCKIEPTSVYERNEDLYYETFDKISSSLTDQEINDVLNIYRTFYLKRKQPSDEIRTRLERFRHFYISTWFNSFNLTDDSAIIHEFINNQVFFDIEDDDYWSRFDDDDNYNNVSSNNAVLLLERFSQYQQKIVYVQFHDKQKDSLIINVQFCDKDVQLFVLKLNIFAKNSEGQLSNKESMELMYLDHGSDFLRECVITDIVFEYSIPNYQENDLRFITEGKKSIDFFYNIKVSYPLKLTKDVFFLNLKFKDLRGNDCELNISNPPVVLKQDDSMISKFFNNGITPIYTIPLTIFSIEKALSSFDFEGITLFSDHGSTSTQSLMQANQESITLFISGRIGFGRNYNKYKIFKIILSFKNKLSIISFHDFHYEYFD